MKKIALALLAALACNAASAQYISTKEVGNANGWTAFTSDPSAMMAGYGKNMVTIYNDDFSVNRTISISIPDDEVVIPIDQIVVSQRLFNSDDLYEVVVQSGSEYKVYNENSELLGVIPSVKLMTVGTKNYIYTYDNNEYTLYALESHTGSALSVRRVEGVRVYPNPVNPGELVRFQLPEGTISDIELYNASGVYEKRVYGGEGTVELPSHDLPNGVHPYRVTGSDGKTHTGKLIVK